MEENKKEEKVVRNVKIDPKEILDAWITSIHPTDLERKRAEARKKVCDECENNGKLICKQCGCFISKKIYSRTFNPCPLEKWGEVDMEYFQGVESTKKTSLV